MVEFFAKIKNRWNRYLLKKAISQLRVHVEELKLNTHQQRNYYYPEQTYDQAINLIEWILANDRDNSEAITTKQYLLENKNILLQKIAPQKNTSYIDKNGYLRAKIRHSDLIHRQKAYREIYFNNIDKYPLPFSQYQIHHKDGNKLNNNIDNLELLTKEQHEKIHNINTTTTEKMNKNFCCILCGRAILHRGKCLPCNKQAKRQREQ